MIGNKVLICYCLKFGSDLIKLKKYVRYINLLKFDDCSFQMLIINSILHKFKPCPLVKATANQFNLKDLPYWNNSGTTCFKELDIGGNNKAFCIFRYSVIYIFCYNTWWKKFEGDKFKFQSTNKPQLFFKYLFVH